MTSTHRPDQHRALPRSGGARHLRALVAGVSALTLAAVVFGCGEKHPLTVTFVLDNSFSYDRLTGECIQDGVRAAEAAALTTGRFSAFTMDGDPLNSRALVHDFTEADIERGHEGTIEEKEDLREAAQGLGEDLETLAADAPQLGGTPFRVALERAGRIETEGQVEGGAEGEHAILVCSDGMSTDPPRTTSLSEARQIGARIEGLEGATVAVVGVGLGRAGRPEVLAANEDVIRAMVDSAGARLTIWDAQLPADFPPANTE